MTGTDLDGLRAGDLDAREAHLYDLLDRARDFGDPAALAALEALVRDYTQYHRSLYTRAMNQAGVLAAHLPVEAVREPLLEALTDTRYNCQAWAAMGCAAFGVRAAVPTLVELLESPQWIIVDEAIKALGALGDASVVPPLRPLLADDVEWVRQRTADALAEIGGPEALDALWHEFEHRHFPRIGHIASALATFTPDVIPRLITASDDPDPNRRYWAAVALGSTGDEQVAPVLERLQAQDRGATVFDGEVRAAAKKALRTLRRIQAAVAAREQPSP
ncbi:HEAT repeat domain-containing protein [Dactylosporangium vinaceum]|uniref:HEAT repeat domain-containing protein n=1 Tax=Dactylosporangium vinaceum TaxID=53362 RepID=A0ABV5M1V2_9ACTN|nr:HEAT repeat domain-containing protein [Dactylosporangium vinaceum]UAB99319.1 HEAT repeat domain-containing protein [Dactylosporangium vinaceum]